MTKEPTNKQRTKLVGDKQKGRLIQNDRQMKISTKLSWMHDVWLGEYALAGNVLLDVITEQEFD